jgi:hypothetical protein
VSIGWLIDEKTLSLQANFKPIEVCLLKIMRRYSY